MHFAPPEITAKRVASSSRCSRLAIALACLSFLASASSRAVTGRDLTARITIDGHTRDFQPDESVFGFNTDYVRGGQPCRPDSGQPCPREEGLRDSQWGFFNDVNQIHVTWDANFLYVGVDGITERNNMMMFFDITRHNRRGDLGGGLPDLVNVNSWRRNISFANGFEPDLFLATWDGNTVPQIWSYSNRGTVTQEAVGSFKTRATFVNNTEDRAMEAAIPWPMLLQGSSAAVNPAYADTVNMIPAGFDTLRILACVTAGADGTGSPDAAPDPFGCLQVDAFAPALLDNFAVIPLDLLDAAGNPNPDGVADIPGAGQSFAVSVRDRIRFLREPPIRGICFSLEPIRIERGVVSPEQGRDLLFQVNVMERLAASDAQVRSVSLTAEIYDMLGVRRRVLFRNRRLAVPELPLQSEWDGRDAAGNLVDGGIYIVRVILEPNQDQTRRSFAVVR